ncbi:MAG: gfo/Idh/MocA family oxidoreductase, partial [Planctomycetota bacterium]
VGNNGTAVMEDGKLSYKRLTTPIDQFTRESQNGFYRPEHWDCAIPSGYGGEHREILENWTDAILNDADLIAPGTDGLNGVMLANAMLLSAWTDEWVDLPFDEAADDRYWQLLQEKIDTSTFEKKTVETGVKAVSSF